MAVFKHTARCAALRSMLATTRMRCEFAGGIGKARHHRGGVFQPVPLPAQLPTHPIASCCPSAGAGGCCSAPQPDPCPGPPVPPQVPLAAVHFLPCAPVFACLLLQMRASCCPVEGVGYCNAPQPYLSGHLSILVSWCLSSASSCSDGLLAHS